jgi:hypothetical protein
MYDLKGIPLRVAGVRRTSDGIAIFLRKASLMMTYSKVFFNSYNSDRILSLVIPLDLLNILGLQHPMNS